MNGEEWRKRICMETDTGYSYSLAKRMEKYRTNPVLGYRTAGSRGQEFETSLSNRVRPYLKNKNKKEEFHDGSYRARTGVLLCTKRRLWDSR